MMVRGVIPLAAIALMAGGGLLQSVNGHSAAASSASPAPAVLHGVPAGSQRPVLSQSGPGQWTTTILLTDVTPACSDLTAQSTVTATGTALTVDSTEAGPRKSKALWDLLAQTASSTLAIPDRAAQVAQVGAAIAAAGNPVTADFAPAGSVRATFASAASCQVTLTFAGLPQVPQAASLVFNDAAASFGIPLTVSRQVSPYLYLGIPAASGLLLVCLLLVMILIFIKIPEPDGLRRSIRQIYYWRHHRVMASSAWTIRDSWATNATSGILVVGAILAGTTATGSLFPGVTLGRFILVDLVAGGIVLAAPAVFGILHARWDRARLPDPRAERPAPRARPPENSSAGPSAATATMTASLATVLVTAIVTAFGIGAEIGTTVVLVFLSDADRAGQLIMVGGILLTVLLLLGYSVTAIGALADRRPGSALTSPSDTSFTL